MPSIRTARWPVPGSTGILLSIGTGGAIVATLSSVGPSDAGDEFFNAGNEDQPHGWLLHINMGYPLCDEGSLFCYDAERIDPLPDAPAREWFGRADGAFKRMPAPLKRFSWIERTCI